MKNAVLFLCIAIACYSCSSTNLMSLNVTQPAPVSLPPYVKTAAVVNRTRVMDENKTLDAIHKAVSLETGSLQAEGASASMSGLADELMKNNRFSIVKPLDNLDLRSFGAGVFPSALPWDTVARICRESNTDVLFSLELFSTESKVSYGPAPTTVNKIIGNVSILQQQVSMTTLVKTGWRIYDPAGRNILDEFVLSKDLVFSSKVINPVATASALIERKEAVKQVGNKAGQAYAYRILPYSMRVSRYYYVRGDGSFKIATRMARTGNWDGAAKIWQQATTSASGKTAGRACYNMAIISEINGDLIGAIQWAQKAYESYNNRLALSYVNVLKNRQSDNTILKAQNEVSSAP
ncbi:MAG: hypothetical protein J0H74_08960 [Chitinophagaceae bacterium]|nr:hypothetical protein [Chitinophagaceae bacterium]